MLSVLIETRNDEERLAITLATLVPGVVHGFVREVIVCDLGSIDGTHHVAEHAGCHYLADGGTRAGIRHAKSEWLLLVEPGARLVDGWGEDVQRHIARSPMAARFTRSRRSRVSFLQRVLPQGRTLADGLVIRKPQALSLSSRAADAAGLARGLSTRRLDAEIVVAAR